MLRKFEVLSKSSQWRFSETFVNLEPDVLEVKLFWKKNWLNCLNMYEEYIWQSSQWISLRRGASKSIHQEALLYHRVTTPVSRNRLVCQRKNIIFFCEIIEGVLKLKRLLTRFRNQNSKEKWWYITNPASLRNKKQYLFIVISFEMAIVQF